MNYRDNCTIIEVGSSCVKKTYLGAGRQSRVLFLRSIYLLLVEKAVPNVDKLIQSYEDHMDHGSAVYVGPRGVNVFPTSAQEVREAVVCILQALVVCLCQCVLCLILTQADLYIRFCMLVQSLSFTETSVGQTLFGMWLTERNGFLLTGMMLLRPQHVLRCIWTRIIIRPPRFPITMSLRCISGGPGSYLTHVHLYVVFRQK